MTDLSRLPIVGVVLERAGSSLDPWLFRTEARETNLALSLSWERKGEAVRRPTPPVLESLLVFFPLVLF
jgi:hypothetical protein